MCPPFQTEGGNFGTVVRANELRVANAAAGGHLLHAAGVLFLYPYATSICLAFPPCPLLLCPSHTTRVSTCAEVRDGAGPLQHSQARVQRRQGMEARSRGAGDGGALLLYARCI